LPAFRLFAGQLSTNPLLLSPQALLDDALLGVLSMLLEPPLSLDGFQLSALLGGFPLFADHLAPELHDADPVAKREARLKQMWGSAAWPSPLLRPHPRNRA
jgi:hypothetical protein